MRERQIVLGSSGRPAVFPTHRVALSAQPDLPRWPGRNQRGNLSPWLQPTLCVAAASPACGHLASQLSLAFVGYSHPPRLDPATHSEGHRDRLSMGGIPVGRVYRDMPQNLALPSGRVVPPSFFLHNSPSRPLTLSAALLHPPHSLLSQSGTAPCRFPAQAQARATSPTCVTETLTAGAPVHILY